MRQLRARRCARVAEQTAATSGGPWVCFRHSQPRRLASQTRAVERDLDWEPDLKKKPATPPPRSSFPPPPPPPPPPTQTGVPWYEVPFASRRNMFLSVLGGSAALLFYNKKVLPPVEIRDPPKDFPFQLAGYTDVAPEEFVYARTPGGNWIASATDPQGRLFMIDEIGDLYYDSGDPRIGLYALDTDGNLFNIYRDVDGVRRTTPVGNIADLTRFKISEIKGIKLDNEVTVVAFKDGRTLELPAGSATNNGELIAPPNEIIEGMKVPRDNPFEKLLSPRRSYPYDRPEVDFADPRPYEQQLFDQVLLDDPDIPGFQPALPEGFDIDEFAKQVAKEGKKK
ncbi:hypothetical protein Rsub_10744 [Raphidocelis subcapitata]|uniref:Uncharacterized protein n=1 Tax=Raphidocelis subcapitata TaxID=307507 RepID=A0A2V0PCN4_9CHLO|nr:hypothetical protein Rsub_10744 [Raphidocelis subcapitata]|eukprot:GBF97608.1 hypothetical protein Rsub_10744 [Raphidocelis subcapitata]